jgi:putative ABC transport system permease protein
MDFEYWRGHVRSFESMAAFAAIDQTLTEDGDSVPIRTVMFSGRLAAIFGVLPVLGRDFLPEEVELVRGGPPRRVALVSDHFSQQHFGSDRAGLGKILVLNNDPVVIIGVLPRSFRFQPPGIVGAQREADAIVNMPFDTARFRGRGPALVQVLGRLKPGVKLETAHAELEVVRAEIAQRYPGDPKRELRILPLHERLVGSVRLVVMILWAAVTFVLLMACVNVANLFLTRAISRGTESAIRAALGASRVRLIWQSLTESLLLAFAGGGAAVGIALVAIRLIVTKSAIEVPRLKDTTLDGKVLLFCAVLCTMTGLFAGMVPAWVASRTNPGRVLNEGSCTTTTNRRTQHLMGFLVVTEIALALVLLTGAGLMLKSLWVVRSQIAAFTPERILTASVNSRQLSSPADQAHYFEELVRRIESLPGVQAAAASGCGTVPFRIVGLPVAPPAKQVNLEVPCVSLHYREALGLRLISGRWLEPRDGDGARPVAVLNQSAMKIYSARYPDSGPPIGEQINTGGPAAEFPTIVGIVSDFKSRPDADAEPKAYVPTGQSPIRGLGIVLVRTSSDHPMALADTIRRIVAQTHGVSMTRPETLEDQLSAAIAPRWYQSALLLMFASVALLLALVGTYGLLSYSVAERTHEIGVRLALGATNRQVFTSVLRRGTNLVLLGVVIGLLGAAALTRLMSNLLYGVKATDPWTHAAICVVLFGLAMAAAYIPARRAVHVDPIIALRYE